MSLLERARWWSYRRQRLGRAAGNALDALRSVIGVYSAHPSGPLSLLARTRPGSLDADEFRRLDEDRVVLRVPAMHMSGHMVPSEIAGRVFLATSQPMERHRWRQLEAGLTADEYRRLRAAVLDAARQPADARALRTAIGAAVPLTPVLQSMAFEGSLLRVGAPGLRSNAIRYVATEAWIGRRLDHDAGDVGTARTWLATEYLRAYGPARVEDFRWWAHVTAAQAQAAMTDVAMVNVGSDLLLLEADLTAFESMRQPRKAVVDVLPMWDCWTMGYAADGRSRFLAPDVHDRAHDRDGNGLGLVLVAGEAVAAWTARTDRTTFAVSYDAFEPSPPSVEATIEERFAEIAAFLGLRETVRRSPPDR